LPNASRKQNRRNGVFWWKPIVLMVLCDLGPRLGGFAVSCGGVLHWLLCVPLHLGVSQCHGCGLSRQVCCCSSFVPFTWRVFTSCGTGYPDLSCLIYYIILNGGKRLVHNCTSSHRADLLGRWVVESRGGVDELWLWMIGSSVGNLNFILLTHQERLVFLPISTDSLN
jgi:hypothetical protein